MGESSDSLLSLINDILDFSKIEAGKLDLESIPFETRGVINEVVRMLSIKSERKGLELKTHVSDDVPDMVYGDPVRLRQILTNLAGNAIKFTDSGSVKSVATLEANEKDSVRLRFEVTDTGVGISEEALRKPFSAFTQADKSITRKYSGSGLRGCL